MALCPEHPKRDQDPKFTPLSETPSIPVCFIWESPPPPRVKVLAIVASDLPKLSNKIAYPEWNRMDKKLMVTV